MNGQAACLLTSRSFHPDQSLEATNLLPPSIRLQLKSHMIFSKAMSALSDNGLSYEAAQKNNAIGMILSIFKSQVDDLETESGPLDGSLSLITIKH